VLFPGMSKRQMYNDCNLTMLDIWDTDSDVDDALCSIEEPQHTQLWINRMFESQFFWTLQFMFWWYHLVSQISWPICS
jgi:hypothetical protein